MSAPLRTSDVDPVVEAYRSGIDVTLIDENLRLTVEQRLLKWMDQQRFAEELRRATEKAARR
ncbi:MAG TPA: hypothetical protein VLT82_23060 [Myxococcaceae bacterium]|nr:hypothetical protein [Myxococcaceae bacterium]